MTTSSTRRTRRSGSSWRAALTVPALAATTLLGPALAAPATAADGDAFQSIEGYCDLTDDLPAEQSTTAPVSANLPPLEHQSHAGRADAAQQIAAAYTDVDLVEVDGPFEDDCTTTVEYSQLLTVGAGTSGLAEGTEVTLQAHIGFAGVLDTYNHLTEPTSAHAELDADYTVEDLSVECPDDSGEGCWVPDAVDLHVNAVRSSFSTEVPDDAHPNGYQFRSHESTVSLDTNTMAEPERVRTVDEVDVCNPFPCIVLTPPGGTTPMDPFQVDVGPRVVEFTTTVGATLSVSGQIDTYAIANGALASATADTLEGLRTSITGLPDSGIEVRVGTDPVEPGDTTAPTVDVSMWPSANAEGWNDTDVTVTYTGADSDGGSVTQLTRSATGAHALPSEVLPGAVATDLITTEGVTQVHVASQDAAGNNSATIDLTVRIDKTPPVVTATAPAPATPDLDGTTKVTYSATATDALDASPALRCTHPSGSEFPVGTTVVTCTATDHAGNTAQQSFDVVVTSPDTVPGPTALEQAQALAAAIDALQVKNGVRESLLSHLRPLTRSIAAEDPRSCRQLANLVKRIDSETRKRLTPTQAADLRTRTDGLASTLGC